MTGNAEQIVRTTVNTYLQGPLRTQPAFPTLAPILDRALILVVGSYALGTARLESDLDVELLVPYESYPGLLAQAGGHRGLWVYDEQHAPLVDVKVRPFSWLQRRMSGEDPMALWVYQHAVVVQDPSGLFPALLTQGLEQLQAETWVARHYRDFRSGVVMENAREPLARQVMLGKTLESALVLPLLAKGEPYPYPKWQSWWLAAHHPQGAEIVSLCEQLMTEAAPFRALRRIIDTCLTEAGYGERLVHHFWRRL